MMEHPDDPIWYKALTFEERLLLYKKANSSNKHLIVVDRELAQKRVDKWKRLFLKKEDMFTRYLKTYGIDENQFEEVIGMSEVVLSSLARELDEQPNWVLLLGKLYSSKDYCHHKYYEFYSKISHFLVIANPVINFVIEKMETTIRLLKIEKGVNIDFSLNWLEGFLRYLSIMIDKSMVLELNIARLERRLQGDTPKERFSDFISSFSSSDKIYQVLSVYPVLARTIVEAADNWLNQLVEMFSRLSDDWKELQIFLSIDDTNPVLQLQQTGDNHRGFHSTKVITFSNGQKVVYKPRSLSAEAVFFTLMESVNTFLGFETFHPRTLLRKNYGWMEYVPFQECVNEMQIENFYKRLGSLLAIFYVLGVTDLHYENLIAHGEYPVPIDLETVLNYPRIKNFGTKGVPDFESGDLSVLRVGLLPNQSFKSGSRTIDISAIGANKVQEWPDEISVWEEIESDSVHLVKKILPLFANGTSTPMINGSNIDFAKYTHELINGFTKAYNYFKESNGVFNKDRLVSMFSEVEARIVFRATRGYGRIVNSSFHPDLLHDAVERELYLDNLWLSSPEAGKFGRVILSEKRDLHAGNIPIFSTFSFSKSLYDSNYKNIRYFFKETAISLLRRQLEMMSDGDLIKQLWLIQASFTLHSINSTGEVTYVEPVILDQKTPISATNDLSTEMLLEAEKIGECLLYLSNGGNAIWLGLHRAESDTYKEWVMSSLKADLYSGLPGIGLFFAYLWKVTQKQIYAEAALNTVGLINKIMDKEGVVDSIGAFDGLGGIIYSLLHIGVLLQDKFILQKINKYFKKIEKILGRDGVFDVVGGAAGCIASLLAVYRIFPRKDILDLAVACGNHLLKNKITMPKGVAWWSGGGEKYYSVPPAGFAHGVAGIAWALHSLYQASSVSNFNSTALLAIDYERTLFVPEKGNWLDVRKSSGGSYKESYQESSQILAWCHGAPGIGLSRLGMAKYQSDPELYNEIRASIVITKDKGFGFNFSLCHGDLGNIELLRKAQEYFNEASLDANTLAIEASILTRMKRKSWPISTDFESSVPGLMPGMAGVGYGLLRLAKPNFVPSILLLEPPIL